ncbi:hypothetical protein [Gloeocapsopsis dulcis]|uniref:Uncharacterized protein n=1 Tax=Gloeocapsopsis dulcis AAB1 = 1H9 TaxID=1433147 RepID=A0A6N8FVS1_9CHRO|nr:hypothetical protein [Gloeocapsopsis dulcis]MUL37173.1 hypothetical protein [Gloeocapsopsis dulcis AAB1 = 1H9]WNN90221.1 hypothetical protein P0S91_03730 [Gloeocapsopsis dulcis]
MDQTGFVFKVLLLSTVISVLIKYGGSYLPLSPTSTPALIVVLLPSIVMAIALFQRFQQQSSDS